MSSPETSFLKNRTTWVVAAFVALFLVVVAIAQATRESDVQADRPASTQSSEGSAAPEPSAPAASGDSQFVSRGLDDARALGSPTAPVVVTVWTDFRCPFCAVFNRDTLPTLVTEYVEPGKVRFEFRDVAFFGEDSLAASAAAEAAGEQGKFVEFMHEVYKAAPEKGHPDMPQDKLRDFARKAGVADLDAFSRAAVDPEARTQTERFSAEARSAGINSVPSFLAGNVLLSGAQPVEVFRSYLDEALAAAGA